MLQLYLYSFFLAEYASIVLICILTSILFLGGYLLNIMPILYIFFLFDILTVHFINILDFCYSFINDLLFNKTPVSSSNYSGQSMFSTSIYQYFNGDYIESYINEKESILFNPIFEGIICGIILGIKSCIMIFVFIWVRASFPRIRFDQLMSFCWTILLPIVIAFIILVPCLLYSFEILPSNILLL